MTHIHPAGGLKVFSTLLHNQIAPSLCSPVTLPWALCHKPPHLQSRYVFLPTKKWRVAHSSKSNKLWLTESEHTVSDYYFRAHTSCVLFSLFFFFLWACLLPHSHGCRFVIFKPSNQYFPKCSLAEGNKTREKEDGRYTRFSPFRFVVQ